MVEPLWHDQVTLAASCNSTGNKGKNKTHLGSRYVRHVATTVGQGLPNAAKGCPRTQGLLLQ
jgi:hypothetical protein